MQVILVLLLLYLHHADSIVCVANSDYTILRSELSSTDDSFTLRKLNIRNFHSSEKPSVCHVTISINYNQIDGDVKISFGRNTNRKGNYFGFETWFPFVNENDSIVSYTDYVCSSKNLCDRIFVDRWIHWLGNIKHEPLHNTLIYILTSGVQSSRCDTGNKLIECSSGMCVCVADYNTILSNTTVDTTCVANPSTIGTLLYVKMRSIELQPLEYEKLEYTCTSHNCTNNLTFNRVLKETEGLFNLIKPIAYRLRIMNQINQIFEQVTQRVYRGMGYESRVYATTHANYSVTTWVWGRKAVAGTLFLAWLYCYYSCCKKSEERLTTPSNV